MRMLIVKSTFRFYNIISFDMRIMKISMHSRIDTETMKQVHCLKIPSYCDDKFV